MTNVPQNEDRGTVSMYFHVPEDVHTLSKAVASMRRQGLYEFVIQAMRDAVNAHFEASGNDAKAQPFTQGTANLQT